MKVVVVGAGLGGLSAAAHLVGRRPRRHDRRARRHPGRPRRDDHRARASDSTMGPRCSRCRTSSRRPSMQRGAEMKDYITINPVDPMYRAVYADGSTLFVRHGREAMTAGDPRVLRRQGRRSVRTVLVLARAAVPRRDGLVHRRQLRLAARPDQAVEVRTRTASSSAGSASSTRRWRRSSTTNASSASSASSRCTPGSPRTRRSRSTPSSPTWTPSRACSSPRAACT